MAFFIVRGKSRRGTFVEKKKRMAEDNTTQATETQQEKSRRQAFMERFAQRYPDVAADDEEAFYEAIREYQHRDRRYGLLMKK